MRFKVCSVSGWRISNPPPRATDSRRHPTTIWYILDRANCYRIVDEFIGAWKRDGDKITAEEAARERAAELEAQYP